MADKKFVAKTELDIAAPPEKVWDALINPRIIKQYMYGATAVSEWKKGSPIVFKGEWQGKPFEDKGVIQALESNKVFQYTHFSPSAGLPDKPENYHTVTMRLSPKGTATHLSLSQDNNSTEQEREHSGEFLENTMGNLKKVLESYATPA